MLEPAAGQLGFILTGAGPISAPVIALSVAGKIVPAERDSLGFRRGHVTLTATSADDSNAGPPGTIAAEDDLLEILGLGSHVVATADHERDFVLARGRHEFLMETCDSDVVGFTGGAENGNAAGGAVGFPYDVRCR